MYTRHKWLYRLLMAMNGLGVLAIVAISKRHADAKDLVFLCFLIMWTIRITATRRRETNEADRQA
jgi:hypothetical protein